MCPPTFSILSGDGKGSYASLHISSIVISLFLSFSRTYLHNNASIITSLKFRRFILKSPPPLPSKWCPGLNYRSQKFDHSRQARDPAGHASKTRRTSPQLVQVRTALQPEFVRSPRRPCGRRKHQFAHKYHHGFKKFLRGKPSPAHCPVTVGAIWHKLISQMERSLLVKQSQDPFSASFADSSLGRECHTVCW